MSYEVVKVEGDAVTVWDGVTRDPDHPDERAGQMTIHLGGHLTKHGFRVGDKVALQIRLLTRKGQDDTASKVG